MTDNLLRGGPPTVVINQADRARDEPPARVRVAQEVLGFLLFKVRQTAVPFPMGCEVLPGNDLTPAEKQLGDAACELLRDYLRDNIDVSVWERAALKGRDADGPGGQGVPLRCFACDLKRPSPACVVCGGTGSIIVYSVGSGDTGSRHGGGG